MHNSIKPLSNLSGKLNIFCQKTAMAFAFFLLIRITFEKCALVFNQSEQGAVATRVDFTRPLAAGGSDLLHSC